MLGAFATTQLLDRLLRRAEKEFLPGNDKQRIERVFVGWKINDGRRGSDDVSPFLLREQGTVENREFPPVDLQRLSVFGESEHQPFGTGALHVPCRYPWRAHDDRQRLFPRLPFDRRAGNFDVHDRPFLLRVAPQGKRDRAPAKHLPFPLSREEILKLHITKQRLGHGHEIQDQFVTTARELVQRPLRARCRKWRSRDALTRRRPAGLLLRLPPYPSDFLGSPETGKVLLRRERAPVPRGRLPSFHTQSTPRRQQSREPSVLAYNR